MKKGEKSGWLLMVPLPHLNFYHFRSCSRGSCGTGSVPAICRDLLVALRGGAPDLLSCRLQFFMLFFSPYTTRESLSGALKDF